MCMHVRLGGLTIITYGDICSPGKYCPEGTSTMIDCPRGYYRPGFGGASQADCTWCDAGFYCNATGLTEPSGRNRVVDSNLGFAAKCSHCAPVMHVLYKCVCILAHLLMLLLHTIFLRVSLHSKSPALRSCNACFVLVHL